MSMIFKELLDADAIEFNLVSGIKKKKETKKIVPTLSEKEMIKVREYLKNNHYTFYRYFEIFFRSGSRSTELFRLKTKDVDLYGQRFKVLVKKGRNYEEQWRAISNISMPFWTELMQSADKDDFVFSINFTPGPQKIAARQVSNKWRKYVKDRLNISVNFYALKHLYTTKVISLYDRKIASGINGHKSSIMNDQHYDTMRKQRILEEAKKIDI